ncbi:hypothetical protein BDZ45DRAFT_740806 [Acephala macrosclerotiorum]|nr:hypothetical protein BDZ45DRAFT_740806 [Acephala macrosclerotiorum]
MAKLHGDQRTVSTTPSEGSGATHASLSSSNPDLARVFVQISNGMKIVVPVPQNSTVHGLHAQALRRAARLGVNGTLDNTLLQTTGTNSVILFGEDSLIDILDLTEDSTFSLESLDNSAAHFGDANGNLPSSRNLISQPLPAQARSTSLLDGIPPLQR